MSENKSKPEHKDRTALYIAIVGATATIIAAFVGVLPNLLNRVSAPPPNTIVITATPAPTLIAQETSVPPTAVPAATGASANIGSPSPAITIRPFPTTTVGRVDFLVTNNRERPFDFFIDDEYQITVPAGGYQLLRVLPGEHKLTHCPRGESPSSATNQCETLAREVVNNPYDWQLGGTIPAQEEVLLFLLNQIDKDVDIYVDNSEFVQVNAHAIGTAQIAPGTHRIQSCPRGTTPAGGECGTVGEFEFFHRVEMYVVNVP